MSTPPPAAAPAPGAGPGPAATLVLGPLLRYVDATRATVWVETDRACTVEVLGFREPTWSVHGHHYALVVVDGLPPATTVPYEVHLDGVRAWPPPSSPYPPSIIRTAGGGDRLRLSFGSCRISAPDDAQALRRLGADALVGLALKMAAGSPGSWPDALLLAGDQVYADGPSDDLLHRLAGLGRHAGHGAHETKTETTSFEEYSWLYCESWSVPAVRWLFSTVPVCMVLDDHDLRDDWNISQAWREEVTGQPWWRPRVVGAFASYWVYQHLGNLSPDALGEEPLLAEMRSEPDDSRRQQLLDDFAWESDAGRTRARARWSYVRDFGAGQHRTRLLVVDARCSRRLEPGRRAMLDDDEWQWVRQHAAVQLDHLLLASTLPVFLLPAIHEIEGWNEATADGAWGRRFATLAERLRQLVDLEHWAAFRASFDAVLALLNEIASQPRPPASVLVLSGDVHCGYIAPVRLPEVDPRRTAVHQLVMSPFRNPLARSIRLANSVLRHAPAHRLTARLARAAGVRPSAACWRVQHGPWFDNGVMTLVLEGRRAGVQVDHARVLDGIPALTPTLTLDLTAPHPEQPANRSDGSRGHG